MGAMLGVNTQSQLYDQHLDALGGSYFEYIPAGETDLGTLMSGMWQGRSENGAAVRAADVRPYSEHYHVGGGIPGVVVGTFEFLRWAVGIAASPRSNYALGKATCAAILRQDMQRGLHQPGCDPYFFTDGLDSKLTRFTDLTDVLLDVVKAEPFNNHPLQAAGIIGVGHGDLDDLLDQADATVRAARRMVR
jgi:hypothetical protein